MNVKIVEVINKKVAIKPLKMNTNMIMPNGIEPFKTYNFALLVVGQPNSGKTSFVFDQLVRNKVKDEPQGMFYKNFHKVFIFSPSTHTITKNLNIPDEQIIKEFDIERLKSIVEEQEDDFKQTQESNNEIQEHNKETTNKKDTIELIDRQQILLIFDDLMTDINKDKSSVFMKIIMNRRHLGISVIVLSQVLNRIPAKVRKGFSDIILFFTKNRKELECAREELTGFNPKEFDEIVEATLTKSHDFLLFKTYNNDIYRNLNLLEISSYE